MNRIVIQMLLLTMGSWSLVAQNNSNCSNASPFCTGQTMSFPATTNVSNAQSGPDYGCLGSEPNPAWFFMSINQTGSISISMSANQDIDFICWGPYPNMSTACNSLTGSFIQSCSYSSSNTETCTIASAQSGSFYIVLITNFANVSQQITFSQSNTNQQGAANTNCDLVCLISGTNSGPLCSGQTATLSINSAATSTGITTFTWTGPGNFNSTQSVVTVPNLTATGVYTVSGVTIATVNSVAYTNTCQATTVLSVTPYPVFSVTPASTTICQGGSFYGAVSFAPGSNSSLFNYKWLPFSGAGVWNPGLQTTLIQPPLLPSSVTVSTLNYSITVTPKSLTCPVTKIMTVTIYNPPAPTLSLPLPVCNTHATMQLVSSPSGGVWSQNSAVSSTGILNPSIASIGTNSVVYTATIGICPVSGTGTFNVSKYNTAQLTSSLSLICEQDPVINLMNLAQDTATGKWSGTGVQSNGVFFDPSGLGSGFYTLTYSTVSQPIATVCPASTVLAVQVFKPPVPIIYFISPKCTNAGTVMLQGNPAGGTWSGNSGVSISGIQTPSLSNNIGLNQVTYAAGIGTCLATSTATFHVSHFNTAALTNSIPDVCALLYPTINLMGIVQSTTGYWSGINVTTNSFFPGGLLTNSYTLTYYNPSNPDPGLCPDVSQTVVFVLNPPVPYIVPSGPFCSLDGATQLSVSPATGTWVSSSFVSTSGLFSPSFAAIGSNQVEYMIGIPSCKTQQTASIAVEAFVPANLSTNQLPDLCNTSSPINLLPYAYSYSGSWIGTGVSGQNFNPAVSGAGKFILTHYTSSSPSALCPDQATLAVQVFSLAAPSVAQAGPFCDNAAPVQLNVTPIGGIFESVTNAAVSLAGLFFPMNANIGDNLVTYSITSGPCVAFAQGTVHVDHFISAALASSQQLAFCSDHAPFNLNSVAINQGGTWEGNGVSGNLFDPARGLPGINYITYYTHSSPDPLLCPDQSTLQVRLDALSPVVIPAYSHCAPLEVSLDIKNKNVTLAEWNLGDGSANQTGNLINYTYTKAGSFSVTLSYTIGSCRTTVTGIEPMRVYALPHSDFDFAEHELTIAEPEVQAINLSRESGGFLWSIEGNPVSTQVNPVLVFEGPGNYRVSLLVTNEYGCTNETTRYIEVKNDFGIYVPNSFTPNYDGLNDRFVPVFTSYGLDPESFEMEIFDRWGHLVLRTNDMKKGWDGTAENKGNVNVKQGVYVFVLKFRDNEGHSHSINGSVTVLE